MDAGVAQAIGGGLGNFGKAMMQGRALAEKARQDALLKEALMGRYEAQSQKDIQEAQIAQERLAMMKNPLPNAAMQFGVPSALLPALSDRIETGQWSAAHQPLPEDVAGPTLPSLDDRTVRNIMRNMSAYQRMIATDSKVDQGERAISEMQKRDYVDGVVADPKLAANVGQAYAATEGKPLWNAAGTTGYSTNNFTGDGMASNPRLTQLFGLESGSRTSENRAQAEAANSQAELNRARQQAELQGLGRTVTIEDDYGNPVVVALPTGGGYRTIGNAPPKGGESNADVKLRNSIIAQVEREMTRDNPNVTDDEIMNEVERRMNRRGMLDPGKPRPVKSWGGEGRARAAPAEARPLVPPILPPAQAAPAAPPALTGEPPGYRRIGTNPQGKPIYLDPTGNPVVAN